MTKKREMIELIKQYFCKHISWIVLHKCPFTRDEFGFLATKGFHIEKCYKCNKVRLK